MHSKWYVKWNFRYTFPQQYQNQHKRKMVIIFTHFILSISYKYILRHFYNPFHTTHNYIINIILGLRLSACICLRNIILTKLVITANTSTFYVLLLWRWWRRYMEQIKCILYGNRKLSFLLSWTNREILVNILWSLATTHTLSLALFSVCPS